MASNSGDNDMIQAEREFLMESLKQIQMRIKDFNKVVDPTKKEGGASYDPAATTPQSRNLLVNDWPALPSQGGSAKSSSQKSKNPGQDNGHTKKDVPAGTHTGESSSKTTGWDPDQHRAELHKEPQTSKSASHKVQSELEEEQSRSRTSDGLTPSQNFADLPRIDDVEAAEIEEILDCLISNSLRVENVNDIKDEDIEDIDPGFLVLSASVGRNHIFANAPYYMGESMVYTLPWDPHFNPKELRTRSVPIWVELPDVPPNYVSYGLAMMNTLGVLVYAAKNIETQHSNLLNGCVLMDISKPLKEEKYFRVQGFREKLVRQKIRYSGFPDSCFECKQRNHIALNCPMKQTTPAREANGENDGKAQGRAPPAKPRAEPVPKKPTPAAKDKDGKEAFQTVKKKVRKPFKDPQFRPPAVVDNRFGVLNPDEDDTEDEEIWEQPSDDPTAEPIEEDQQEQDPFGRNQLASQHRPERQQNNINRKHIWRPSQQTAREKRRMGMTYLWRKKKLSVSHPSRRLREHKLNLQRFAKETTLIDFLVIRVIRSWLKAHQDVKILGLQEIKTTEKKAELSLRSIYRNGHVVIDYASNNKGGAVLLVDSNFKVNSRSVRGDGSAAWMKLETPVGKIGVICIYASTKSRFRIPLWRWLLELMEEGMWVVLGDYNSVKLPDDTQGSSNLLNGSELRVWKYLTRHTELTDVFFLTINRKGPRYTRQRIRKDRMEFARLDRVYTTDGADWIAQIQELEHDGTSGLSDHYHVVVSIQFTEEEAQTRQWRTYFKFRHQEMQTEEVKLQIKQAWQDRPKGVSDPRIHWDLGWNRVKRVMQKI
ncbi:hypothetical protein R1sor_016013 [Riccia sorocarpa]|uniref:Endonuclease/exonuclease/phosphatase domain-containing protein n=1 Tax=Riccia sorocarpa TaxID=122646 RepID=A0ABD3HJZ6_9MARC